LRRAASSGSCVGVSHIVNKVGGRFKLSTLIQKRLVQLNRGSRPLVELNTHDKMEVVIQEILQDKIFLTTSSEVKLIGEGQDLGDLLDLDAGDL